MGIKTILVPESDGTASLAALKTAFAVAQRFGAHVDVLHVKEDAASIAPHLGEGVSWTEVDAIIARAKARAEEGSTAARRLFDDEVAKSGLTLAGAAPVEGASAAWHEEFGREEEALVRRGRLADLIVVGHPDKRMELPSSRTLHAGLMETGRPLLMAPPKAPDELGNTVAIAWNGSIEASRAVGAAVPFLQRARTVTILVAEEGETSRKSGEQLAAALAWHGITAEVAGLHVGHDGVARSLLGACHYRGTDLLVMGAYSRSRLREVILGGVTRDMLRLADIPVFMTH